MKLLIFILIIIFSANCFPQNSNKIKADSYRITIQNTNSRTILYGTDYEVNKDSIYLKSDSRGEIWLSKKNVKLYYEDGDNMLIGFVVGGIGGAIVGSTFKFEDEQDTQSETENTRIQNVAISSAGFGLLGAIIGFNAKSYSQIYISESTKESLSYNFYPSYNIITNSPQLSLQIRF